MRNLKNCHVTDYRVHNIPRHVTWLLGVIASGLVLCYSIAPGSLIGRDVPAGAPSAASVASTSQAPGAARNGKDESLPNCETASPFSTDGRQCASSTDKPLEGKELELFLERDARELATKLEVKADAAIDVLRVVPGASVAAYKTALVCGNQTGQDEKRQSECADIFKIMPYVLMDLEFRATEEHDRQAALLMAQHHAGRLPFIPPEYRSRHTMAVGKYLSIIGGEFPDEVRALQKQIEGSHG